MTTPSNSTLKLAKGRGARVRCHRPRRRGRRTSQLWVETLEERRLLDCSGANSRVLEEDFENIYPYGSDYSPSMPFYDSSNDYWHQIQYLPGGDTFPQITPLSRFGSVYANVQGSFYWAAEDTDDDGGNGNDEQTMDFTGIDIRKCVNLTFSGYFAAGGVRFDATDHLIVDYRIDGAGGFQTGLAFESTSDAVNQPIAQDTNFDGLGDGRTLDNNFGQYSFSIPAGGNTLELRVRVQADTVNEELAFDYFRIFGDEAPNQAPVANSLTAPDVGEPNINDTSYDLTVTYDDDWAIDVSTIDVNDVAVIGPGGPLTVTGAIETTGTDGTPRTVTYSVTPPGGSWDAADNGTYDIHVNGGEVGDDGGPQLFVPAGQVGSFTVDATNTPPTITGFVANDVTPAQYGQTSYDFTIDYSDLGAVDVSSIDAADVTVTGPGGALTITGGTELTGIDGSPKQATYSVTPPGGSWDAADAGTYTVAVAGGQVFDVVGASVTADPNLTTFEVIGPEADISITKDDGRISAVPGQDTIEYTIVVANAGPDDAPSVSVADNFPALLTCDWTSVASGGATGNTATGAGDLDETLSLPVGSSVAYTTDCDINSGATGTIANTATANSTVSDPDVGNNSATDDDTVLTPMVDIQLSKVESIDPVVAGSGPGNLVYTVTAFNAGPSDAAAITIDEVLTLPAGVTVDSVVPSSGTFVDPTWSLDLGAGASETLTVTLTAAASAAVGTDVIGNTATLTGVNEPDTDNTNDSATESTSIAREIDIELSKLESIDPVVAGSGTGNLVYTVTAFNAGPSDASGITIDESLTLPAGVTVDSVVPSSGSFVDPTWSLDLAAGASETLTVTLTADASAAVGTDVIGNTATFTGANEPDTNNTNDSATESTAVARQVDIQLSKVESIDPVVAGSGTGNLVYTVTAFNAGPSDASGITIDEAVTLPDGVTVDSVVPSAGTFVDPTWSLDLAAGASETLTVTLTAAASAAVGTDVIGNTVTLTGVDEPDTDNTNDSATESTSIAREIDVELSKLESIDPVVAGSGTGNLVYTVTAFNAGPSDASGITIDEALTLPAGVTVDSVIPSSGTFVDPTWSLDLVAGASETLTVTVTADASATDGAVISNTATVTAVNEVDTDTTNDSASAQTAVQRQVDLQVTKLDTPDPVIVHCGAPVGLTHTVTVTNAGPSNASGIVLAEAVTLPVGVTIVSMTPSVGTYLPANDPNGIWTVGDLDSGASQTLTILMSVEAGTADGATVSDTATVTAVNEVDTDSANDAATEETTVRRRAALYYVSSTSHGKVDGISFRDEDILVYNTATDTWSMHFDGSDVGPSLFGDVDAFLVLDDGRILLSYSTPALIPGVGLVDDSDILRFTPTSLGANTAGTFTKFFDGSDVGLTTGNEDVDAIGVAPNGSLVLSTTGSFRVPRTGGGALSGRDEDLIVFDGAHLGAHTAGTFRTYFDGSDVGLTRSSEDVKGTWIDGDTGDIYLTTGGNFAVPGLAGDESDVFLFTGTTGHDTSGTFNPCFEGGAARFGRENVDGASVSFDVSLAGVSGSAVDEPLVVQSVSTISEVWDGRSPRLIVDRTAVSVNVEMIGSPRLSELISVEETEALAVARIVESARGNELTKNAAPHRELLAPEFGARELLGVDEVFAQLDDLLMSTLVD